MQVLGVGRSPQWLFSARPLVEAACELVRIGGSVFSSETFSSVSEESKCSDQDRQYNGYALHKQTRGYKVSPFMSHKLGFVELGFEEQYPDQSCTYISGKRNYLADLCLARRSGVGNGS